MPLYTYVWVTRYGACAVAPNALSKGIQWEM